MQKKAVLLAALIMPDSPPNVQMTGFRLVESRAQKRSLELEARKAQMWRKQALTVLHQVDAKIWAEQGDLFEVVGTIALLDDKTQDLRMAEDAQITTPDGYVFASRDVTFDDDTRIFSGSEEVDLHVAKGIKATNPLGLKGRGLSINLDTGHYRVKQQVRASQQLQGKKLMQINSRELDLYPRENRALFAGQVQVNSPDFVLKSDTLQVFFKSATTPHSRLRQPQKLALKALPGVPTRKVEADFGDTVFKAIGLDIHLNPEGGMDHSEAIGSAEAITTDGVHMRAERLVSSTEDGVQKMRMYGNVRIQTSEREATCQEAIFVPSTGNFTLERVATLYDEKQNIRGERIHFSTKNRILKVEKATGQIHKDQLSQPSSDPKKEPR